MTRSISLVLLTVAAVATSVVACKNQETAVIAAEPTGSAVAADAAASTASAAAAGTADPKAVGSVATPAPTGDATAMPSAQAQASGTPPSSPSTGPGQPPSAGKIKLLSPGKEPRQKLRYKLTVGQKEQAKSTLVMAMGMKVGPKTVPKTKLPPMAMYMEMEVTEKRPNGDYRYTFAITKSEVVAGPGANPQMVAKLQQQLSGVAGMNGYAVVTDRGLTREAKVNVPKSLDPQAKQFVQSLEQTLHQLGTPIPEEAVGVGAKWEHSTSITQSGMTLKQVTVYDLAALAGDEATLNVKLTQSAPKQKISPPGLPPGAVVELTSLKSAGEGRTVLHLLKVVPVKVDMKLGTSLSMLAEGQSMQIDTDMEMLLAPN